MISLSPCLTTPPPLFLWLLVIISSLPNSIHHHTCFASPAGIEAVLDPLGDLVQVVPSLALHQEEAEKSLLLQQQEDSIKSIKTPAGTVKCSCQTVSEEESQNDDEEEDNLPSLRRDRDKFARDPTKTIEIEIYKPVEDDEDDHNDGGELTSEDRSDVVKRKHGKSESGETNGKKKQSAFVRNSFTLDSEEGDGVAASSESFPSSYQDRVFSNEEPTSFLSFLSSLVASSAQEDITESQSQSLRGPQPEEIDTEVKQESDVVEGASIAKEDVNVANHRLFDTVSTAPPVQDVTEPSNEKTVYKAFRSTDLTGSRSDGDSGGSGYEKMDGASGNVLDEFFLWDFIYAGGATGAGKKRELLQLGSVIDPFKGPRRRRRKRRSLKGNGNSSPVVFVYPVPVDKYNRNAQKDSTNPVTFPENRSKTTATLTSTQKMEKRYDYNAEVPVDQDKIRRSMQAAMDRAWEQYGNRRQDAPPVTLPPPAPPQNQYTPNNKQQPLVHYTPPHPFLFSDRIFNPFRNEHLTVPERPPPLHSIFSRFIASYIDFEVNNHETADLMRKVVFGIFIGFLIAGWIALGAVLGIVPFKKLLAFVAGSHYDIKRHDKGKEFMTRDTTLAEISDKILLSLDADWLRRLEERVMDTEGGKKFPAHVFCCILPDEKTMGMVECQIMKQAHHSPKKKTSAVKCLSDLIYNFNFGPREDDDEVIEGEQSNVVNVKSKANQQGKLVATGSN